MFALLELDTEAEKSGGCFSRRRAYEANQMILLGMRVMRVKIKVGHRKREKSIRRLLRTIDFLRGFGIHSICFENGFVYTDFFLKNGFKMLTAECLFRTYGAYIAAASGREGGTAYVYAARCDLQLWQTLRFLSRRYRYIFLDTAQNDPAELASFTQRTGVSVVQPRSAGRFMQADAAIFFAAPQKPVTLARDCVVVCCDGRRPEKLRGGRLVSGVCFGEAEELYAQIPPNFPSEPIISAAIESGALLRERLHLCGIRLEKNGT